MTADIKVMDQQHLVSFDDADMFVTDPSESEEESDQEWTYEGEVPNRTATPSDFSISSDENGNTNEKRPSLEASNDDDDSSVCSVNFFAEPSFKKRSNTRKRRHSDEKKKTKSKVMGRVSIIDDSSDEDVKPKKMTAKQEKNEQRHSCESVIAYEGQAFQCPHCDKSYNDRKKLERHKLSKHNPLVNEVEEGIHYIRRDFEVKCPNCKVFFRDPAKYRTHPPCNPIVESFVDGENRRRYRCFYEGCVDTSTSLGLLGAHISRIHYPETDNPFQCLQCYNSYFQKEFIVTHVVQHHLNHHYTCEEVGCQKIFGSLAHLRMHRARYHKKGPVPEEGNLEGIEYTKQKFERTCPNCDVVFLTPPKFRVHSPCFEKTEGYVRDRFGVRFKCRLCLQSFGDIKLLGRHISISHFSTTDLRYQCKRCRGKCIDKKAILSHLACQHNIGIQASKARTVTPTRRMLKNATPKSLPSKFKSGGVKIPKKKKDMEDTQEPTADHHQLPDDLFAVKQSKNFLKDQTLENLRFQRKKTTPSATVTLADLEKRESRMSPLDFQREVLRQVCGDSVNKTSTTESRTSSDFPAVFTVSSTSDEDTPDSNLPSDPRRSRRESGMSTSSVDLIPKTITSDWQVHGNVSRPNPLLRTPRTDNPFTRRLEAADWKSLVVKANNASVNVPRNSQTVIFTQDTRVPFDPRIAPSPRKNHWSQYDYNRQGISVKDPRLPPYMSRKDTIERRESPSRDPRQHVMDSSLNLANELLSDKWRERNERFYVFQCNRRCPKCHSTFTRPEIFSIHDPCYGTYPNSFGKLTTDSLLRCSFHLCLFETNCLDILRDHVRGHFPVRLIQCKRCLERFRNYAEADQHYLMRHPFEQPVARPSVTQSGTPVYELDYAVVRPEPPRTPPLPSSQDLDLRHHLNARERNDGPSVKWRDFKLMKEDEKPRRHRHYSSDLRRSQSPSRDRYRRSRSRERRKSPEKRRSPDHRRRNDSRSRRSRSPVHRRSERDTRREAFIVSLPKKDPCPTCNERHSYPTSNRTHYPCFMQTKYYIYDRETDSRLFQCRVEDCLQKFKTIELLGEHETSSHYSEEDAQFMCSVCKLKLLKELSTFNHIRNCHRTNFKILSKVLTFKEFEEKFGKQTKSSKNNQNDLTDYRKDSSSLKLGKIESSKSQPKKVKQEHSSSSSSKREDMSDDKSKKDDAKRVHRQDSVKEDSSSKRNNETSPKEWTAVDKMKLNPNDDDGVKKVKIEEDQEDKGSKYNTDCHQNK